MTTDDTRRAGCLCELRADGRASAAPVDAEAVVDDEGLTVGDVRVEWLDADTLEVGDHRLTLGLWPQRTLVLSHLARRFDAFSEALASARDLGRVAGVLAHAPAAPAAYAGAVRRDGIAVPARILVYPTHVTIVPENGDPFQVAMGAMTAVDPIDDPPSVALRTRRGDTILGQLARRRDAFLAEVTDARARQEKRWADYSGQAGFSDGVALPRGQVKAFDALLARCCAPERLEGARWLAGLAGGVDARIGFAQLLDPEPDHLQAPSALPDDGASFLLVPTGSMVVFEILSGPSAATYLFEAPIGQVNEDLQALHLRRGGLALTGDQARIGPGNPYRLALRRLAPLQRLRAATSARIVHSSGWRDGVAAALGVA